MTRARSVHREQLLTAQNSQGAAGTARRLTIRKIDGIPLQQFDDLIFMLDVTTALVATGPAMELHGMRPLVPSANEDTLSHWDGLFSFDQTTPATGQKVVRLPWIQTQADETVAAAIYTPGPIAAGKTRTGRWEEAMTIWEEIAGTTVTQVAIYDLYVTGIIYK